MSIKSFFSKVAGVTKANPDGTDRQKILKRCKEGDALRLERDPDNPYDKNAIKVCLQSGEQIGWLSKELASNMTALMKGGYQIAAEITDLTGGGFLSKKTRGCNIKITIT